MIEGRAAEPLLPLSLFRLNTFRVSSGLGFITGAAMFGSVTFLPIYLQIAKGVSPTTSGLLLVPLTAGILTASLTSGRIMGRTGHYKKLPLFGLPLVVLGMALLTTIGPDTSAVAFGAMIGLVGLGMGTVFPVITTAVQNAVPFENLGTATAAGVMFRQIGGSLSVALFGTIFAARLSAGLAGVPGAEGLAGGGLDIGPETLAQLPAQTRELIAVIVSNAVHPVFWIATALAVVGVALATRLEDLPLRSRGR